MTGSDYISMAAVAATVLVPVLTEKAKKWFGTASEGADKKTLPQVQSELSSVQAAFAAEKARAQAREAELLRDLAERQARLDEAHISLREVLTGRFGASTAFQGKQSQGKQSQDKAKDQEGE